jgi:glycosyltransferase involved in cell wall biosynthesis
VILSLQIGGLEGVVVNLVSRASRDVDVHVLCLESLGPLAQKLAGMRATVECIGTPNMSVTQSVRALRRRLAEIEPDVVHTHNEKAHIHGALATLGWSRPALVHTRHGRGQVGSIISKAANRLAIHRTRFIACVSADATAVARAEGARPEQLKVVLNAIDVSAYDVSNFESRAATPRAVTVARLAPVKDIGTMVRAARSIKNAVPDFRLDIVGDGESRPELELLSRELELTDSVTFHGASIDPRPYLSHATVFLQSSISEGISLTLLEAMAAGLPIVATDVGGNREVVEVGRTGLLVEPRSPEALAEATLRVLGNPATAVSMSRAARTRAEQVFSLDRMVADYEALYREALQPC